jgi:hypothetical protein
MLKIVPWVKPIMDRDLMGKHWVHGALAKNPNAIRFFETILLTEDPNMIDWDQLSQNPAAIHLLEANFSKINWWTLS